MVVSAKRFFKGLLPSGHRPRRVLTGLYAGLRLHLDLQAEVMVFAGLYERETHRDIARMAGTCEAFVDIGAGKGELTCYWLRRFPGRPVIAVEPNSSEVDWLRQNVEANFHSQPRALSVWPGCAGPGPDASHRGLAQLCAGLPGPILVKIDIDGGEAALLENAAEFLSTHSCRLLLEVHSVELEQGCAAVLARSGYAVRTIDQAGWRRWLPEQRPLAHNRWIVAEPLSDGHATGLL